MVAYTFHCRRCAHRWSRGCTRDLVRLVRCPKCDHDRLDYDCTAKPLPPANEQPFVLGTMQRMMLVMTARAKGQTTVDHLAASCVRGQWETRQSLQSLADHRMIELSDAGDVALTEIGWLLAVNIRERAKGEA